MVKICSLCGIEKSLDEFHKHKHSKDGHRNRCKECRKSITKKYREENTDKVRESQKRYREDNKELVKQRKKEYYENNKEKLSEKIECDKCKSIVTKCHLKRHQQSKKCLNYNKT